MRTRSIYIIKLLFMLFYVLLSFSSCRGKQQEAQTSKEADTTIEWTKKNHDFGNIAEGETVTHSYYFKNKGEQNFVIRSIETGCGCTTISYDKQPIKAGKEGKIEIAFNSSGRYGKQYKEISIFANVPEKKITLHFSANVK